MIDSRPDVRCSLLAVVVVEYSQHLPSNRGSEDKVDVEKSRKIDVAAYVPPPALFVSLSDEDKEVKTRELSSSDCPIRNLGEQDILRKTGLVELFPTGSLFILCLMMYAKKKTNYCTS